VLNPYNTAHLGVLRRLEFNKIKPPVTVGAEKVLQRGLLAPKDKDKDKDKKEEGSGEKPKKSRPNSEQITIDYCLSIGLPASDGEYFWAKWIGNGFRNNREAMRDWKGVIRSWKAGGHCPSQRKQTQNRSAAPPPISTWGDRKALKEMIGEVQEQKNEMFKMRQRQGRSFTPDEQRKYDDLAKRLEHLKSA
jgi:hypothetical protein